MPACGRGFLCGQGREENFLILSFLGDQGGKLIISANYWGVAGNP